MAVLLFSLHLGWLPSSGYTSPLENLQESLIYLILPAIAIGFRQAGDTTRLTRSSMLDEMNTEYVDTARSLGFRERKVVYKFTLRNAMISTLTISGLLLADLLGGIVVLEAIFTWPGVGRVIYEAIIQRDYPMIQSGILVPGVFVVLTNLVVTWRTASSTRASSLIRGSTSRESPQSPSANIPIPLTRRRYPRRPAGAVYRRRSLHH